MSRKKVKQMYVVLSPKAYSCAMKLCFHNTKHSFAGTRAIHLHMAVATVIIQLVVFCSVFCLSSLSTGLMK